MSIEFKISNQEKNMSNTTLKNKIDQLGNLMIEIYQEKYQSDSDY
jgi:hypothetical protein